MLLLVDSAVFSSRVRCFGIGNWLDPRCKRGGVEVIEPIPYLRCSRGGVEVLRNLGSTLVAKL